MFTVLWAFFLGVVNGYLMAIVLVVVGGYACGMNSVLTDLQPVRLLYNNDESFGDYKKFYHSDIAIP